MMMIFMELQIQMDEEIEASIGGDQSLPCHLHPPGTGRGQNKAMPGEAMMNWTEQTTEQGP